MDSMGWTRGMPWHGTIQCCTDVQLYELVILIFLKNQSEDDIFCYYIDIFERKYRIFDFKIHQYG